MVSTELVPVILLLPSLPVMLTPFSTAAALTSLLPVPVRVTYSTPITTLLRVIRPLGAEIRMVSLVPAPPSIFSPAAKSVDRA
jgi:hypothetical protein